MATIDEPGPQEFFHGTRADLRPGDLIKPGHTSNYFMGKKTVYVYLTGTLDAAVWGAELARGEGPARVYTVEPTGPMLDDPDLTDKRFPGNPTKSYCSREPLRVTGEVSDWQRHSAETIQAMKDHIENVNRGIHALAAEIPDEAGFARIHTVADDMAREGAADSEYLGSAHAMTIRGEDVRFSSALDYRSSLLGETLTVRLPHSTGSAPGSPEPAGTRSGRVTQVTGWREGWVAALESCTTEIGLASQVVVSVVVDADRDKLTFGVVADAPDRSWHRSLELVGGVLSDSVLGEIWYFEPASS